jgi:four helix bundle protein
MQDFRRLTVWADAHALTLELYGATRDFPDSERLGPTRRPRRASALIPANFAEGCGGGADFARFISNRDRIDL